MRTRSAAILIQNNSLALIERHRNGMHYFAFPGGGVDGVETPEQAAVREVNEELGMEVKVLRQVAKVWFRDNPQFFFLVEQVGGEFGTGTGKEFGEYNPIHGTYHPMWMPIAEIAVNNVLPAEVAALVARFHANGWPTDVVTIYEEPH